MKKATRLIALFATLVLVCLSATGCNAIDEMREHHGYYTEAGSIMLGDTEYLLLPENEYFSPFGSSDEVIYATQKDVPLLLCAFVGDELIPYNDGMILVDWYSEVYYCRADKYDEVAAQMAGEFTPTGYCYTYSAFNTKSESYEERAYLLTEEQKNAVRRVLATVEGVERADNAQYTYDYVINLEVCTDNMLLRNRWLDIEKTDGTYYIVNYNESLKDNGVEYTVPFAYNTVFDAILKNKIDAEEAEKQYYSELYDWDEDEYDIDYEVV